MLDHRMGILFIGTDNTSSVASMIPRVYELLAVHHKTAQHEALLCGDYGIRAHLAHDMRAVNDRDPAAD